MTILETMQHYRDQLDTLLTGQPNPQGLADRPLTDQLALFEQLALGKRERDQADPAFVAEVEEAINRLLVLLCVPPDIEERTRAVLPPNLWERSALGLLLADVLWWLYQDDMMTMSHAAELLYGAAGLNEFQKIRTLVNKGVLVPYINPHESNPQTARRFRKSQVLTWKAQQSQGKPNVQPVPKDELDIVALHDHERKSFQEIGDLIGVSRQAAHQMYQQRKSSQRKK
ncbi:MAG TPA: hypothetical protein VGD69_30475 [Herpetosiphonaceae bacterium]